jgi:hypothetical protein
MSVKGRAAKEVRTGCGIANSMNPNDLNDLNGHAAAASRQASGPQEPKMIRYLSQRRKLKG